MNTLHPGPGWQGQADLPHAGSVTRRPQLPHKGCRADHRSHRRRPAAEVAAAPASSATARGKLLVDRGGLGLHLSRRGPVVAAGGGAGRAISGVRTRVPGTAPTRGQAGPATLSKAHFGNEDRGITTGTSGAGEREPDGLAPPPSPARGGAGVSPHAASGSENPRREPGAPRAALEERGSAAAGGRGALTRPDAEEFPWGLRAHSQQPAPAPSPRRSPPAARARSRQKPRLPP